MCVHFGILHDIDMMHDNGRDADTNCALCARMHAQKSLMTGPYHFQWKSSTNSHYSSTSHYLACIWVGKLTIKLINWQHESCISAIALGCKSQ